MKIRSKITLSFFTTIAILAGISLLMLHFIAKNSLEKAIYPHLNTIAQSRASHIETFLEANKEAVKQLSKSIVAERFLLADRNDEDFDQKLNDVLRRLDSTVTIRESVDEIFILSTDGKIIASTNRSRIGLDRSDDICFLGAKKGPYIKDAYNSQVTGQKSLAFSSPLTKHQTGELLGVIVTRVGLEPLNEIVTDKTGLGKTGDIYLVNKYGYMITPSRFIKDTFLRQKVDTENTRMYFEDIKRFGTKPHKHEAHLFTDYRGVKVLGTHYHIHQMSWCLCVEIDEKEALVSLATVRLFFIIVFFALLAAVLIVSRFLSSIISAPIYNLRKGAEIIGTGDLEYKVATKAQDEIGELSRAFDKMTRNLNESTTSIDKLNKEIAERKRAEQGVETCNENLKAAVGELNAANRDLTDFAHATAHDLKAPLRAIGSLAGMISEDCGDELDEQSREKLDMLVGRVGRMSKLIDGILQYSELGRAVKKKQVNLNEVLQEAIDEVAPPENIEISIENELPVVMCERTRMIQVFQNLLSNAVKYMDKPQGQIKIACVEENGFWKFSVADNGPGIEEKYFGTIFQIFQTLAGRDEVEATGIGLSLVRKIVEIYDGKVWLKSKPGQGSTFFFTLPKQKTAVKNAELQVNTVC